MGLGAHSGEPTFIPDGRYRIHTFCAERQCNAEFTRKDIGQRCCPYCGADAGISERSMRWVPAEREWWELHKIFQGKFVGRDNDRHIHEAG